MPARDKYHNTVIHALEKDGWLIVRQQVLITIGKRHLWLDLKAERDGQSIYVEVKGFETDYSLVDYLYASIGQCVTYLATIDHLKLGVPFYLAVPQKALNGILNEVIGQIAVQRAGIQLMRFDIEREEIVQWNR